MDRDTEIVIRNLSPRRRADDPAARAAIITALRREVADCEQRAAITAHRDSGAYDLLPWRQASHLSVGFGLLRAIRAAERGAQTAGDGVDAT